MRNENVNSQFANAALLSKTKSASGGVTTPPSTANPHRIRVAGYHLFSLIALIGLILLILPACSKQESASAQSPNIKAQSSNPPSSPFAKGGVEGDFSSHDLYLVTRVIDGDTIVLEDGTKVRYIGIDTPETKHPKKPVQYFGKEASEANKQLVLNKKVRLEYDVQKTDKYGRTLAYVYLEDGTFVNAYLVEQGFARVSTYPPNVKYQSKFVELERKAREGKRGLWGK